jgi:hypothetical protein
VTKREGALQDRGGFIVFLVIMYLLGWHDVLHASWTNAVWYAVRYQVSPGQVISHSKPTDCDWTRAPLGNKGYSYKATVNGYNAAGELVAGDNAPKYSRDTNNGKPIISYDDGKTWTWFSGPAPPDPKVKSVLALWEKVTE